MKPFNKTVLASMALLVAGPALSAPTSKLSWFNDTPFAGVGALGVPEARLLTPSDNTSFGINLFSSRQDVVEEENPTDVRSVGVEANTVRLYGDVESPRSGTGTFSSASSVGDPTLGRVNAFGVSWKHRMDAMNSFAVSAEYGEGTAVYPQPLDTLDTRAAFSWTSVISSAAKPSITGSVFFGDEMAREEIYRNLGRKYYGFTLGGSLTLFQSHTPYVSFKMQRSQYDATDDSLLVSPRSGDRSLLSAGWKWQVQRDLSLQAEASYGLGETPPSNLDTYSLERSRIFFGTRFDFK